MATVRRLSVWPSTSIDSTIRSAPERFTTPEAGRATACEACRHRSATPRGARAQPHLTVRKPMEKRLYRRRGLSLRNTTAIKGRASTATYYQLKIGRPHESLRRTRAASARPAVPCRRRHAVHHPPAARGGARDVLE